MGSEFLEQESNPCRLQPSLNHLTTGNSPPFLHRWYYQLPCFSTPFSLFAPKSHLYPERERTAAEAGKGHVRVCVGGRVGGGKCVYTQGACLGLLSTWELRAASHGPLNGSFCISATAFPRHSFSSEFCFRHSPLPLPQFLSAGGGNATLPLLFPPRCVCVEGHAPARLRKRQAGLQNDAVSAPRHHLGSSSGVPRSSHGEGRPRVRAGAWGRGRGV